MKNVQCWVEKKKQGKGRRDLLHGSGTLGLSKLVMLDQQTGQEPETHERDTDPEGRPQRQHVGLQDLSLHLGTKRRRQIRVRDHFRNQGVYGNQRRQVVLDTVVKDRAGNGNAKDGSNCTEKRRQRRGNRNVLGRDRGLNGKHRGLHRETDADTADKEESNLHASARVYGQQGQKTSTDRAEEETNPDEGTVLAPLGDQKPRRNGSDQETNDQRQQLKARGRGSFLTNNLEVQWHKEQEAKESHAEEEAGGKDGAVCAGLKQVEGDDGLSSLFPFNGQEDDKDNGTGAEHANDNRRAPGIGRTTPIERQQDQDQSTDQRQRSQEIDTVDLVLERTLGTRQVQQLDHSHDRDQTDGQVDKEGPAPGGMVGKDSSQKRSNDRRETKDGTDDTLVLATVAKRDQVGDDDHDRGHDTSGTNTSNTAGDNDPCHALSSTTERGSDEKHADSKQERGLTTKDIREFAVPKTKKVEEGKTTVSMDERVGDKKKEKIHEYMKLTLAGRRSRSRDRLWRPRGPH